LEKPADFRFGSARILGQETGHTPVVGGSGKGWDSAERALSCYSAAGQCWRGRLLRGP